MHRTAAVYVRISRDRTGAGLGVDRQEADCRELADRLGWNVGRVYVDNDVSASSGRRRPAYEEMLADLETGAVDAVIAWHTDRLHRRPTELEHYVTVCDKGDVPTHTVKSGPLDLSTPSGKMVARTLGTVARFETEHASERARRAAEQRAERGAYGGGRRPFGYETDGVTVRPAEADVVRRMFAAALAGESIASIKRTLERDGVPTSTGSSTWPSSTVRKMLTSARYAGLRVHHGEVIGKAEWPAIVDEDTWRTVSTMLRDPSRRTSPGAARKHLLGGLAMCGLCGAPMKSATDTRSTKKVYVCSARKHLTRDMLAADTAVELAVIERLGRPDVADLLTAGTAERLDGLRNESGVLRRRLDDLAALFAAGDIDARQLAEGTRGLRQRLEKVDADLAAVAQTDTVAALVSSDRIIDTWTALPLDRRRAVIDLLMAVEVPPAPKGRPAGWQPGQPYMTPDKAVTIRWKAGKDD